MTDKTLYEEMLATESGQQGLAAAAAASRVGALLDRAFDRSGLNQDALAKRLGVSKGRVSQVLHGDGNVHIATAARFMKAMGYDLDLRLLDEAGVPLPEPRKRGVRTSPVGECRTELNMTWIGDSGVSLTKTHVIHQELTPPLLAQVKATSHPSGRSWDVHVAGASPAEYATGIARAVEAEGVRSSRG